MKRQRPPPWRLLLLLLALLSIITPSLAAAPTTFCKCTCFRNSTIVPLDSPVNADPKNPGAVPRFLSSNPLDERATRKKTCNDCNRQFCLSYPFCKDKKGKAEKEENVLTQCFQRDSAKDQAVVYIFILATVGLLSYAAVRPWVERWKESRRDYIPVSGQN